MKVTPTSQVGVGIGEIMSGNVLQSHRQMLVIILLKIYYILLFSTSTNEQAKEAE